MKKLLVLLIILISSHQAFAQFGNFETCEEAEQQAIEDAAKGMYKWPTNGLVDIEYSDLSGFYEIYMYSKYNIDFKNRGLFADEKQICYTKKMVNLVEANFGPDFIEKKETEVASIFPTLTEQDKAEILDLN